MEPMSSVRGRGGEGEGETKRRGGGEVEGGE